MNPECILSVSWSLVYLKCIVHGLLTLKKTYPFPYLVVSDTRKRLAIAWLRESVDRRPVVFSGTPLLSQM